MVESSAFIFDPMNIFYLFLKQLDFFVLLLWPFSGKNHFSDTDNYT